MSLCTALVGVKRLMSFTLIHDIIKFSKHREVQQLGCAIPHGHHA